MQNYIFVVWRLYENYPAIKTSTNSDIILKDCEIYPKKN